MEEATRTLDSMIAKGYSPSQELLNIVLHTCISGKITSKVSVADKPLTRCRTGGSVLCFGCPLRWRSFGAEAENVAARIASSSQ